MSEFRSLFVLKLTAFFITVLSCISLYAIEYKDIQGVREKEGYKPAFILLKQLAEQGNAQAQFELGAAYEYPLFGEPIKKDINEAIKWYTKAAIQGNLSASKALGDLYYVGKNTPRNYMQAFKWYKLAAEQGCYSDVQLALGAMYEEGVGTKQNYIEAHKYYNIAASMDEDKYFNKYARESMNELESRMTPEQIATAQNLAKEWVETH